MTHCPMAPKFRSMEARIAALEGEKTKPVAAQKPVRREGYINVYAPRPNGRPRTSDAYLSRAEADKRATSDRESVVHITWNSDGSLEGDGEKDACDEWKFQCEQWAARASEWAIEGENIKSERDAWKAMADKLCERFGVSSADKPAWAFSNITFAIESGIEADRDAWKAQCEKWAAKASATSESHEAMGDKCCDTCRVCAPSRGDPRSCADCRGFSGWAS